MGRFWVPIRTVAELSHGGLHCPPTRAILHLLRGNPTMFDELWSEIQDSSGEIFDLDIPELQDKEKFNFDEYLKGDYDY